MLQNFHKSLKYSQPARKVFQPLNRGEFESLDKHLDRERNVLSMTSQDVLSPRVSTWAARFGEEKQL